MSKIRVSALLELETIEHLTKEAKEKSISVSAVIRQKVEASYKLQEQERIDSFYNDKGC